MMQYNNISRYKGRIKKSYKLLLILRVTIYLGIQLNRFIKFSVEDII